MKNPVLSFIMFVILVLVGVVIWQNYEDYLYAKLSLNNTTNKTLVPPKIIPNIPYQFTNIIILIVGIVIMLSLIIGLVRYFTKD